MELESGAWLRATERPKLAWKEGTPDLDIVLFSMGSYSVGSGHGWLAWILVCWAAIKTAG